MRLLHTVHLVLDEFSDDCIPPYVILSHRWGTLSQEVNYDDLIADRKKSSDGFAKIVNFCEKARLDGYAYCWIDTCCIDKRSSAELSEAINSMYKWYQNAEICFAYLNDVDRGDDMEPLCHLGGSGVVHSDFYESLWFTRGWTLQELIAPKVLVFYNKWWERIGTRTELAEKISSRTGIHHSILCHQHELASFSIAQRFSWAANRKTSRAEDRAYSLLGLLDIQMPLLYGEGHRALRRLQEHLLTRCKDDSLFAWSATTGILSLSTSSGDLLAPTIEEFADCGDVVRGLNSYRILFEISQGSLMIMLHRSFDDDVADELLGNARPAGSGQIVNRRRELVLPLGCYRKLAQIAGRGLALHLSLDEQTGEWQRSGILEIKDQWTQYTGPHNSIYTNDYLRLHIRREDSQGSSCLTIAPQDGSQLQSIVSAPCTTPLART